MSGRLRGRVDRLRRERARSEPCEACAGRPPVVVVWPGEDPPEPGPCPACGRRRAAERVVVEGGGWTARTRRDRPER